MTKGAFMETFLSSRNSLEMRKALTVEEAAMLACGIASMDVEKIELIAHTANEVFERSSSKNGEHTQKHADFAARTSNITSAVKECIKSMEVELKGNPKNTCLRYYNEQEGLLTKSSLYQ
ncbi:MAG: hypothetical protein V7677_19795 [Motiliproteus sp.]